MPDRSLFAFFSDALTGSIIAAGALVAVALITGYFALRAKAKDRPMPITPITSEPPPFLTKPRVLIVDDNRELLQAMRLFLNGDFLVREFEFPHDALRTALTWHDEGKQLDLAIVDYQMNKMSGPQVAIDLRNWFPSAKIVFFTGGAGIIDRKERALVDDVWQKPIRNVKKAVEEVLAR